MKMLWAFALALPVIAVAVPANAFVDVTALIFKDKQVLVLENVDVTKVVVIKVHLTTTYHGAAEAQAIGNQLNAFNRVKEHGELGNDTHGVPLPFGLVRDALIDSSVNWNDGIVGVNQDVGNMVNQGNAVAIALTNSDTSLTNSQAEADQINVLNRVRHNENLRFKDGNHNNLSPGNLIPDFTATIDNSVNHNIGVVHVNQNAGNMNNQYNSLALAIGLGSKFALSEAALGQVNAGNDVSEIETVKYDLITGSVNSNQGVTGVNQSTGNMNNQASVVSMAVLASKVSIVTPGATSAGP
jgi:hypothetical protein